MSSYSEYLNRKMQRTQKIIDTRPRRDAGHQTEIVKRLAASAVQEQKTTTFSGNLVLDGPSTRVIAPIKGGHCVQATAIYNEYTAGQAVASSGTPPTYINQVCYSASVVPEINDKLAADSSLAAIQAAKNVYQRGWNTAAAQQVNFPTSVSRPEVPS